MPDIEMNQLAIKTLLTNFCNNKDQCGLDAFVVMKTESKLKQMSLSETKNNSGDTFRDILKGMLFSVISDCYLAEEVEYIDGTRLADNQLKYLILKQDGTFTPFSFINNTPLDAVFSAEDLGGACGLAFKLRIGEKTIWCYQHLWSIMVPNRKKNNVMARFTHFENQTIFEEQKESLLTIARKIDIIVVDDYIITKNINLLQNNFGFQNYIYQSAEQAVRSITEKEIVSNTDKLTEYISRGKSKYAKKMMRIGTSKVFSLSTTELLHKVQTVDRWKGKFNIDEATQKIILNTYIEVESLIDLFDERFTRSDITDTEYDTDVKSVAKPLASE